MSGAYEPDGAAVSQLAAVAGCDESQARFLLEACQGNVDQAVQMYYDTATLMGSNEAPQTAPTYGAYGQPPMPPATSAPPPRPRAPVAAPQQPHAPRNATGTVAPHGLVGTVVRLPFTVLRFGFGAAWRAAAVSLGIAAFVGDRLLPAAVMTSVRGAAALLGGPREEPDAATQAQRFILLFKSSFGDRHPRWVEASWKQAAQQAAAEFKFLLVYLHAEEHQDTSAFCRDVVCAPEVVEYVNQHFVSWGGDVRVSDSFALAGRLAATTYPFVALLAHSGSRTKLVAAVQGAVSADHLMAVLRHAVNEQGVLLAVERADRARQDMDRSLRDEQNQEYEASLAADRQREAARQAERDAAAAAERERLEEEGRARAEAEAEERQRIEAAAAKQRRREEKRAGLTPEAIPGPGSAQVRIRMPDGSTFQRCFDGGARVCELYDYVDSLETAALSHPGGRYTLCTNFPRRAYGHDVAQQTLSEAGLVPSAMLLVQPDE